MTRSFLRLLFAPLVALVSIAMAGPAPAARIAAPEHAEPAGAAVDALIASAKDAMLADPGRAAAQALAAEKRIRNDPAVPDRAIALATAEWLQGEAHVRLNEIDRARPLIDRAWNTVAKEAPSSKLAGDIMLSRGGVHSAIPDVAAALSDYHKAFKIYRAIDDRRAEAVALLQIASLYIQAGDNAAALRYYDQVLDIYQGDPNLLLALYNSRGNALKQMGRSAEALTQFDQALALAEKMGSRSQQGRILRNIARAQTELGDLDAAAQTIDRGLALAGSDGDSTARAQFLGISATLAQRRGNVDRAQRLIDRALAGVDLDTSTLAYRDLHETAYQIYKASGERGRALEHLEALKRLDDQTAQLAASTNTALMAARFDYTNQNLRIAQLKAEELRRSVQYERESARFQRIIFVGIAVATLILVVVLVISLITIRRSRNQVRAANVGLAESNTALAKALAAKTEFLATTSHEIRTPLNGILGMTQVMLADRGLAAEIRDRVEIVHGAGVTMRALVDDILDVAKMETGNMTVEHAEMDVCAVLRDVARMWEEQARAKGIDFALELRDCPALVMGDAARLRQIVFNLLANALKFTARGRIRLAARATGADTDRRVEISVSDTGIGIEADKLDAIFESFRQADTSTTRRFGGTGLGLSICRNLARAMDGDVRVASVPGEGSIFTIDLPLIEAEARAIDPQADADDRGLLIVERNPITRSMMRALFEPCVPWVEMAGSVADAERLLANRPVALAIVDDNTAADAGPLVEVMAHFAATAMSFSAKTALLVHASADARAALRDIGVDTIIDKPIAGAALRDRLFPALGLPEADARAGALVSHAA